MNGHDGCAQVIGWLKAQKLFGAPPVSHADEAEVVEFGGWEVGEVGAPCGGGDLVGDGAGQGDGVLAEGFEDGAQGHFAGADDIINAFDAGLEGALDSGHCVLDMDQLHHRVEAHQGDGAFHAQVGGGGVADRTQDMDGAQDDGLNGWVTPEERGAEHVELDEAADVSEPGGGHEGALFIEKLVVVGGGAVDVGAGQEDQFGDVEALAVFDHLAGADDVERVLLFLVGAGVVHDVQMYDGAGLRRSKDVLHLAAADVYAVLLDVLGEAGDDAAVDADDGGAAVEALGESAA